MSSTVLEALERARQAWARSQPQLTLEGIDSALDEGQVARADITAAACLSSSAPLTPTPSHPRGRGALDLINRHRAARPPESQRGPVPEGAIVMAAPFTIVTLVDDDEDEFPVRLPGVYRENRAADVDAAVQIAKEQAGTGTVSPNGVLRFGRIEYVGGVSQWQT